MFRKLTPWLIAVAAATLTAVTATPASADVIIPIQPNQHFDGLVNGKIAHATIATVNCHPSPFGSFVATPAPGQSVKAVLDLNSDGFTGSRADSLDVWIPSVPGFVTPPVVLHDYNQPATIPVNFAVPCSGPGQVQFVPHPTSKTAVTETVDATFVPVLPPAA